MGPGEGISYRMNVLIVYTVDAQDSIDNHYKATVGFVAHLEYDLDKG